MGVDLNAVKSFFYKMTWSEKYQRATLYNHGCNLACRGCFYKATARPKPKPLELDAITAELGRLSPERVHFIGGEPALNPDLPELLAFAKQKLGAYTYLGHTNGWGLPMPNLDAANVGFKAADDETAIAYTGKPVRPIFESFKRAFEAGAWVKANIVLIPGLVEQDQVVALADFLASLDRGVPLHINGFVQVPDTPWRPARSEEVLAAVEGAQERLDTVTCSIADAEGKFARDDRFDVVTVLEAS